MSTSQNICIASAIITDEYGRCLLVRKRGTTHFIQPGGKMEPDENPRRSPDERAARRAESKPDWSGP